MKSLAIEKKSSSESQKWEVASCPSCASQTNQLFRLMEPPKHCQEPIRIVQCTNCEMVYLNPRPSSELMGIYYHDNYSCNQFYPRGGSNPSLRDKIFNATFVTGRDKSRVNQLKNALPSLTSESKILDYGCGAGSFLIKLREEIGCHVTGLENASSALTVLERSTGIPAFRNIQELEKHNPEAFDGITLCHVLEHLHDPLNTLRKLKRISHAQTRLVIELPNIQSWPASYLGNDWLGWDAPRHLSYFSPKTLREMLEQSGWQIERIYFPPQVVGLVYSLASKLGFRWLQDMHAHVFQICPAIGLCSPLGLLMSLFKKNDFLITVATPKS